MIIGAENNNFKLNELLWSCFSLQRFNFMTQCVRNRPYFDVCSFTFLWRNTTQMHCVKCRNFTWFPGVESCGKTQFPQSFERSTLKSAELCVSIKFSRHEIRWNFCILCSDYHYARILLNVTELLHWNSVSLWTSKEVFFQYFRQKIFSLYLL